MSADKVEQPPPDVGSTGAEQGGDRTQPMPDTTLGGRYRLGRQLGKGGIGEVFAAHDVQIARDVAIKRMRAAHPSEATIQRFLREAIVQGRLEHPAIVPVHEIGRDSDGLPYFAMKKLTGASLARILDDRDVPPHKVLRAFADVCFAVEFAHVRRIVHRHLKPDNIMLGDFGEIYVLGWGDAKIMDGDLADVGTTAEAATCAEDANGTPGYMAPEQIRGDSDVDGRADVYALGCLLFEILAGQPLHARTADGSQEEVADNRPSSRASQRDIPPELDALCAQATVADRAKRIQTARELGERVERFLDGDRDLALRRVRARAHFERAGAAFAASDKAANLQIAMREAAAAVALDPELRGAAELVGRLMLEPPRDTPPEVRQAMAEDDILGARAIARAGLSAWFGGLFLIPLLWSIAPPDSYYMHALVAAMVLEGIAVIHTMHAPTPRPGLVVIANAVLVVVAARMFSPLLIAPGLAASLTMAMVLTPRFSVLGSPVTISVLMVGAVLGPLLLERIGVVSTTMSVGPEGILFAAPALSGHVEGSTIVVASLYALALIVGSAMAGYQMRARAVDAARHLHMQAWQLRQLVPR